MRRGRRRAGTWGLPSAGALGLGVGSGSGCAEPPRTSRERRRGGSWSWGGAPGGERIGISVRERLRPALPTSPPDPLPPPLPRGRGLTGTEPAPAPGPTVGTSGGVGPVRSLSQATSRPPRSARLSAEFGELAPDSEARLDSPPPPGPRFAQIQRPTPPPRHLSDGRMGGATYEEGFRGGGATRLHLRQEENFSFTRCRGNAGGVASGWRRGERREELALAPPPRGACPGPHPRGLRNYPRASKRCTPGLWEQPPLNVATSLNLREIPPDSPRTPPKHGPAPPRRAAHPLGRHTANPHSAHL